MEDHLIIALYENRSVDAIQETHTKYGSYCHTIAYNILRSHEDSEECVNDTYLKAWASIPPEKPKIFRAYLAKITRNLSLNRYNMSKTQKRGNGDIDLAFEELEECISSKSDMEQLMDEQTLSATITDFLATRDKLERIVFLRRYWYFNSIKEIALGYGMSESKVKSMLHRTRNKLGEHLKQEGYYL